VKAIFKYISVATAICSLASGAAQERNVPEAMPQDSLRVEASESIPAHDPRTERGLVSRSTLFVPQGQWIFGGTLSYSTHRNKDYSLLILDGINSKGYTFKVSPMIGYAIYKNMAVGIRFAYSRTLLNIDSASISFSASDDKVSGEADAAPAAIPASRADEQKNTFIKYYYALQHSYSVSAWWRQYIPLGSSRRFALFTDIDLTFSEQQGKFAKGSPITGLFQKGYTISLGVNPGLIAFATNNVAIEVNVGILGLTYSHVAQTHNQIETGSRSTSMMNFNVNIFSIGLGMSFYL